MYLATRVWGTFDSAAFASHPPKQAPQCKRPSFQHGYICPPSTANRFHTMIKLPGSHPCLGIESVSIPDGHAKAYSAINPGEHPLSCNPGGSLGGHLPLHTLVWPKQYQSNTSTFLPGHSLSFHPSILESLPLQRLPYDIKYLTECIFHPAASQVSFKGSQNREFIWWRVRRRPPGSILPLLAVPNRYFTVYFLGWQDQILSASKLYMAPEKQKSTIAWSSRRRNPQTEEINISSP